MLFEILSRNQNPKSYGTKWQFAPMNVVSESQIFSTYKSSIADLICIRFRLNSPRPIWKIGKWLLSLCSFHIFPYIPLPKILLLRQMVLNLVLKVLYSVMLCAIAIIKEMIINFPTIVGIAINERSGFGEQYEKIAPFF